MKHRIAIILLLFISFYKNAYTQTVIGYSESYFAAPVDTLLRVLKNHATIPIALHPAKDYGREEMFYDSVMFHYFCYNRMIQLFNTDTTLFAVAGKLDIVRHSLNTLDMMLDSLTGKAYFLKESYMDNRIAGVSHDNNRIILVEVYCITQGTQFTVATFYFYADCLQPVGLSPMIRDFDQ